MAKFYDIIKLYKLVRRGRLTTVERAIRNILRGKNIDVYRVISYAVCTIDTEEDLWFNISKNIDESSRKREMPMGSEAMQKCLLTECHREAMRH